MIFILCCTVMSPVAPVKGKGRRGGVQRSAPALVLTCVYSPQPVRLLMKLHTSSTLHLLMSSAAPASSPSTKRPPMAPVGPPGREEAEIIRDRRPPVPLHARLCLHSALLLTLPITEFSKGQRRGPFLGEVSQLEQVMCFRWLRLFCTHLS